MATKSEAIRTAANTCCTRVEQGAGVTMQAVKGQGGLPEAVVVIVSLRPDNVVEFTQMVDRWAKGKRMARNLLALAQ